MTEHVKLVWTCIQKGLQLLDEKIYCWWSGDCKALR